MDNEELQYRLIYSIVVAGKSAKFAEQALKKLFEKRGHLAPFTYIRRLVRTGKFASHCRECRIGNYAKNIKALMQVAVAPWLDLRTCSPADLEKFHGVGPKTSRFFILWTRPDARYAALDVHILRWMRNQGYDAPRSTPAAGPAYEKLEQAFLAEADKRGLTPRELDSQIWDAATNNVEWKEKLIA